MGWVILIIAVVAAILLRERKNPPPPPPQPVRLDIQPVEAPYFHFTGCFWSVSETLARAMPFREAEVVITVRRLDAEHCAVDFQFDLDSAALPPHITFGEGLTAVKGDGAAGDSVRFETRRATQFSTPELVKRMILQDMSSSDDALKVEPVETTVLTQGDFARTPLVICRFKMRFEPAPAGL